MGRPKAIVITARALKDRCAGVVTSIMKRNLATKEEVDWWRPGGSGNADTTVWGWFAFHNQLLSLSERDHLQGARQKLAGDSSELELLAMMGGKGERVDLITPLVDGDNTITSLTVEPKGIQALVEIDQLDHDCRWLAARLVVLQELIDEGMGSAGDLQSAQLTAQRIDAYLARMMWILTSQGSGCPYDPERDSDPAAPAYLRDLDPLDQMAVLLVHKRVHNARLQVLNTFIPRTQSALKGQPSWATFIGATAREIHEDTEVLIKHWSLQKIITSATLSARARLDAEAEAKAAAAKKTA